MTREEILRRVDEQDAAFNRHDAAAIAATYAIDARMRDAAAGGPIEGREAVRAHIDGYMKAFPDLRWERVGLEIDGDVGVEEWRCTGTHEGDMPGLPATHRQMTVDGCSVLFFGDDGLVREEHNYWDEAAMLRQLGAMVEPAATA
ncbi:MAG: ester cyclase [Solirubrobacteraceae bacterium]|nr:ester cyclase [Solirubrobacteraceae bacterium]